MISINLAVNNTIITTIIHTYIHTYWAPLWSSGSVLDHRSLPPVFESRRGHIWRLFRLSLRLITFGGRSAHLPYLVHKSGRKTSIIIIIITYIPTYYNVNWWWRVMLVVMFSILYNTTITKKSKIDVCRLIEYNWQTACLEKDVIY